MNGAQDFLLGHHFRVTRSVGETNRPRLAAQRHCIASSTPAKLFGNRPSSAARKIGSHRRRQSRELPDFFLSDMVFTATSLHNQLISVTSVEDGVVS
jgi:hypothetical protein